MTPNETQPRTSSETNRSKALSGVEVSIPRTSRPGDALTDSERRWPKRIRQIGRAQLRLWDLEALTANVEYLLTELVTNALQHGGGKVGVRLRLSAAELLLEVSDESPVRARARPSHPDDESGRGLLIVAALSDTWGVSRDGTCTWCTLRRP